MKREKINSGKEVKGKPKKSEWNKKKSKRDRKDA